MCGKPKRLVVHYIGLHLSVLRFGTQLRCWLSKALFLFIKIWVRKREKNYREEIEKKNGNERKASHRCRSLEVLKIHPPSCSSRGGWGFGRMSTTGSGVVNAFDVIWRSLTIGPGVIARQRVSSIMCHAHAASHFAWWLWRALVVYGGNKQPKTTLSKTTNSWFPLARVLQYSFHSEASTRLLLLSLDNS